jgi:hypothetical protein
LVGLLVFLAWGLGSPAAAQGQNFSGLLDKELTVVEDLESTVENLLGDILGGARGLDGEIEGVVVTDDRERSLSLLISLSGFAAADLHGKILDSERELVQGIAPVKIPIDSTTTEAEMVFELAAALPEGTSLESMYVKLELNRPGRRQVGKSVLYLAEKQWQVEVRPENVIVTATARPVGDSGNPGLAGEFQPSGAAGEGAEAQPAAPLDTAALRPVYQPAGRVIQPARLPTAQPAAAGERVDSPTVAPAVRPITARYALPQEAVRRAYIRPELYQLKRPVQLRVGLSDEQREKGAQGPGTRRINLLQLRYGGEALSLQDLKSVLGIDPWVYQDHNANSGMFYFVPSAYRLLWNPEDGYGLNILFRTAEREGEAGRVHMAARLTADISVQGMRLASQLLEAWAERTPGAEFESLDPMPLRSAELEVSLSDDLERLYDIPASEIVVQSATQLLSDLEIEWVTDDVTANDMMVVLERRGIRGHAEFEPAGDLSRVQIPIEISLTSSGTYPPYAWGRGGQWRNATAFPLHLRYVHALLMDRTGNPAILSWDLGGAAVPPQARFTIADAAIQGWQEEAALDMWIQYAVDSECESCAQLALDEVKDGSTELARDWITFRTLRPLADLDAYMIMVELRSHYFHPRERDYRVLGPLELLEDDASYEAGPIYLPPEYESGDLPELFQYRLFVVMPDGTEHPESGTPEWVTSGRPRVNVGSAQVRQSLGYLPGEGPPDR